MDALDYSDEDVRAAEVALIRKQNDAFRRQLLCPEAALEAARQGLSGRVMLTQGIAGEAEDFQHSVMAKVAAFEDFSEDNDPYGDHSFGSFEEGGERLFWRIDLYDTDYVYGSPAPADPAQTRRVLTIARQGITQ